MTLSLCRKAELLRQVRRQKLLKIRNTSIQNLCWRPCLKWGKIAMSDIIMSIENLTKKFPVSGGKFLTACDNISFHVRKGETIGIVGESGCGKTTLLKAIMNMQLPTSGRIIFHGKDITKLTSEEKRQNYKHIQMVFHDATPQAGMRRTLR